MDNDHTRDNNHTRIDILSLADARRIPLWLAIARLESMPAHEGCGVTIRGWADNAAGIVYMPTDPRSIVRITVKAYQMKVALRDAARGRVMRPQTAVTA